MAQGHNPRLRRRAALAGTAAVMAMPARAQAVRRLGALMGGLPDDPEIRAFAAALVEALSTLGWKEGSNLHIDWRWQGRDPQLLERDVADLVALQPDVLLAMATPAVKALQRKTAKIPIVFALVTDAVGQRLVQSLTKPGGNITGFSDYDSSMAGKWVQLLTQIIPPAAKIVVLFNPAAAPFADLLFSNIEQAAGTFKVSVRGAPVNSEAELRTAMASLARESRSGLIVLPDSFSFIYRKTYIELEKQCRLPAVYWSRLFVREGGFMSYGTDNVEEVRRSAEYIDRILQGAKPADLPVQLPTRFELAINQQTAKEIGVTVPKILLAMADEIIE